MADEKQCRRSLFKIPPSSSNLKLDSIYDDLERQNSMLCVPDERE